MAMARSAEGSTTLATAVDAIRAEQLAGGLAENVALPIGVVHTKGLQYSLVHFVRVPEKPILSIVKGQGGRVELVPHDSTQGPRVRSCSTRNSYIYVHDLVLTAPVAGEYLLCRTVVKGSGAVRFIVSNQVESVSSPECNTTNRAIRAYDELICRASTISATELDGDSVFGITSDVVQNILQLYYQDAPIEFNVNNDVALDNNCLREILDAVDENMEVEAYHFTLELASDDGNPYREGGFIDLSLEVAAPASQSESARDVVHDSVVVDIADISEAYERFYMDLLTDFGALDVHVEFERGASIPCAYVLESRFVTATLSGSIRTPGERILSRTSLSSHGALFKLFEDQRESPSVKRPRITPDVTSLVLSEWKRVFHVFNSRRENVQLAVENQKSNVGFASTQESMMDFSAEMSNPMETPNWKETSNSSLDRITSVESMASEETTTSEETVVSKNNTSVKSVGIETLPDNGKLRSKTVVTPKSKERLSHSLTNVSIAQPHWLVKYDLTMSSYELNRLDDGVFLNDYLIDLFAEKYFEESCVPFPSSSRQDLHLFSSHFFTKMDDRLRLLREKLLSRTSSPSTEDLERMRWDVYSQIMLWTRGVDIFAKRFLLFPINKSQHWSLTIVNIELNAISTLPPLIKIYSLDSLGSFHSPKHIKEMIRLFLNHEWRARKRALALGVEWPRSVRGEAINTNQDEDSDHKQEDVKQSNDSIPNEHDDEKILVRSVDETFKDLTVISVEVSLQQDAYNCGVYMLKNIREFFTNYGREYARLNDATLLMDIVRSKTFSAAEARLYRQQMRCEFLQMQSMCRKVR